MYTMWLQNNRKGMELDYGISVYRNATKFSRHTNLTMIYKNEITPNANEILMATSAFLAQLQVLFFLKILLF